MELDQAPNAKPVKVAQTYKLMVPISWGQETITEITIPPLKGKHVKLLKKDSGMQEFLTIASKASGVSMAVFDEMDAGDALAIVEVVGNFI